MKSFRYVERVTYIANSWDIPVDVRWVNSRLGDNVVIIGKSRRFCVFKPLAGCRSMRCDVVTGEVGLVWLWAWLLARARASM